MSLLAGEARGASFNDLREQCGLTDGNLNRHLKVLEEAGAVSTRKILLKGRACTIIGLSDAGRVSFAEYLNALESVLQRAEKNLAAPPGLRSDREKAVDGLPGDLQPQS